MPIGSAVRGRAVPLSVIPSPTTPFPSLSLAVRIKITARWVASANTLRCPTAAAARALFFAHSHLTTLISIKYVGKYRKIA